MAILANRQSELWEDPNQRRASRYPVNLRFRWRTATDEGQAFSRQIAEGGVFLKTDHTLKINDQIEISFCLPGDRVAICCQANVRYNLDGGSRGKAVGVGLEFQQMSELDKNKLKAFLNRLSR